MYLPRDVVITDLNFRSVVVMRPEQGSEIALTARGRESPRGGLGCMQSPLFTVKVKCSQRPKVLFFKSRAVEVNKQAGGHECVFVCVSV